MPAKLPEFRPSSPKVLAGPNGASVWLFERHNLPLVDVALVVPNGSALDPKTKTGLTYAVARMLTEGTTDRDPIAFAEAIRDLGASLGASVTRDTSSVSMQVLSDRFAAGMGLLADAVLRPRFDPKDYERVRLLWQNALVAREQDPAEVARMITPMLYFGPGDPYGHPPEGRADSPKSIGIREIRDWHGVVWRPEHATFVIVGDVTEEAVSDVLAAKFGAWRAKGQAPRPAPPSSTPPSGQKIAVVDRSDAPQVVLSIAEPGVRADSEDLPRLSMLNLAFGGSFGSRLNQDLREKNGWTYGAGSAFAAFRSSGLFVLRAALRTDAVTDALRETLRLASELGDAPLSGDEWTRVRAQAQGDVVTTYGNLRSVSASLAENAGLGLAPDHDARFLEAELSASPADLAALAKRFVSAKPAVVVFVGPKAVAEQAALSTGLPPPEPYDTHGNRLTSRTLQAR